MGIATLDQGSKPSLRRDMIELTIIFLILPVFFALPLYTLVNEFDALDSYFEAISCFTTTGATLIENYVGEVPPAINLWRALVGWMGGLVMWVTAATIIQHFGFNYFYSAQSISVEDNNDSDRGN